MHPLKFTFIYACYKAHTHTYIFTINTFIAVWTHTLSNMKLYNVNRYFKADQNVFEQKIPATTLYNNVNYYSSSDTKREFGDADCRKGVYISTKPFQCTSAYNSNFYTVKNVVHTQVSKWLSSYKKMI